MPDCTFHPQCKEPSVTEYATGKHACYAHLLRIPAKDKGFTPLDRGYSERCNRKWRAGP